MSEQTEQAYWCHQCESFLTRAMGVMRPAAWPPHALRLACPHCGEDWAFGVWEQNTPCALRHALAAEAMYPGDCDCPDYKAWQVEQDAAAAIRARARRSEAAKRGAATRRQRRAA